MIFEVHILLGGYQTAVIINTNSNTRTHTHLIIPQSMVIRPSVHKDNDGSIFLSVSKSSQTGLLMLACDCVVVVRHTDDCVLRYRGAVEMKERRWTNSDIGPDEKPLEDDLTALLVYQICGRERNAQFVLRAPSSVLCFSSFSLCSCAPV